MKKIIKPIIILSTLFLFSCNEEQAQEQKDSQVEVNIKAENQTSLITKNVTVKEFKQLIEKGNGAIIDVRTPGEYTRGNIEGSKNINIAGNFSQEIQKLDKNKPVYVYCAVGGRSSRAMQMMNQMGFKEVYNLMGGYNAWSR
jgi:rhodanese-related sulfurtransferase